MLYIVNVAKLVLLFGVILFPAFLLEIVLVDLVCLYTTLRNLIRNL